MILRLSGDMRLTSDGGAASLAGLAILATSISAPEIGSGLRDEQHLRGQWIGRVQVTFALVLTTW